VTTPVAEQVLRFLAPRGALSFKELCEGTGLEPSWLNQALNELRMARLVTAVSSPTANDRIILLFTATRLGREWYT